MLLHVSNSLVAVFAALQAVLAIVDATSFVPVKRYTPGNELLRTRDLHKRHELLRPRSDIDLHYLPDDGSNTMLVTVTASHTRSKYVMLEDLDSLLSGVACSTHSRTLSLSFRREESFKAAKELWSRDDHLLFVTNHRSCNNDSDRAVYKSTNLAFDDATLQIMASSCPVSLGDSSEASSKLIISGSEITENQLRVLARRDTSPKVTKSSIFDLSTVFTPGKDQLISAGGMDLFCDDCKLSGQAMPFFKYQINTDIMDCVDQIAALKKESNVLEAIVNGIGAGVECVGDAIEALADGLEDDIVDLIQGNPDKKLPILGAIVPEAIVGIKASQDVNAKLNLEASSTVGLEVDCAFPAIVGKACDVQFVAPLLSADSPQAPPSLSFRLGTLKLNLGFAFALSVSARATGEIDIKVPVTASVNQGESAQLSLITPAWHNTFQPKVAVGSPTFEASDPEVTLTVSLGPSFLAKLSSSTLTELGEISASASLDLPKVEAVFKGAQNVDSDCNPGNIENALELDVDIKVGLTVGVDTIFKDVENLTPFLFKEFDVLTHCFSLDSSSDQIVVNGSLPGNSPSKGSSPYTTLSPNTTWPGWNTTSSPGPYSAPPIPTSTSSPQSTMPSNVQGIYNSPFDCTGLALSPGGQPCANSGGSQVTCTGLYNWSCPNGDTGVVPADTICACGAFRHPGWQPPAIANVPCTQGIYCYDDKSFGVCSAAGIEPAQPVAPGTVCVGGKILYPQ